MPHLPVVPFDRAITLEGSVVLANVHIDSMTRDLVKGELYLCDFAKKTGPQTRKSLAKFEETFGEMLDDAQRLAQDSGAVAIAVKYVPMQ
ncbi:MAG TPA: hypothetical protein VEH84_04220 [Alphaproteobacteria bacterium]|nr:hypothetical protein [Alphaproteobacteria bacterium]